MRSFLPALICIAIAPCISAQTADNYIDSIITNRGGGPTPAMAVRVSRNGRPITERFDGMASLEHNVPAGPASRFSWASVSKQVTGFIIAILESDGVIDSDQPVQRYVPDMELRTPVTIAQLLYHTSGIEDVHGLLALAGWLAGDIVDHDVVAEILKRQTHVRFRPGSQRFYGNGGYSLLVEVAERVTGVSFNDLADSLVFKPLGMTTAAFRNGNQAFPDEALPYSGDPRVSHPVRVQTSGGPGPGGLVASIEDMDRFLQNLVTRRYRPDALELMLASGSLPSGTSLNYGYGVAVDNYRGLTTYAHSGGAPGVNTASLVFPDAQLTISVAVAADQNPPASFIAYRLADAILADRLADTVERRGRSVFLSSEMLNERPSETVGIRPSDVLLRSYAGTYRAGPDEWALVIRPGDGFLELARDGQPPFHPLFPLADSVFIMPGLFEKFEFLSDGTIRTTPTDRSPIPMDTLIQRRVESGPAGNMDVAGYPGLYFGEETQATYRVRLRDGELVLTHPRHGDLKLIPLGNDEFGIDSYYVARAVFARNADDEIVAMELEAYSWSARSSFMKIGALP